MPKIQQHNYNSHRKTIVIITVSSDNQGKVNIYLRTLFFPLITKLFLYHLYTAFKSYYTARELSDCSEPSVLSDNLVHLATLLLRGCLWTCTCSSARKFVCQLETILQKRQLTADRYINYVLRIPMTIITRVYAK